LGRTLWQVVLAMFAHAAQDLFYELDVSVLHDDARAALPAGRVVVAIPGTPDLSDMRFFSVTFGGVRSPELDTFLQALRRAGAQS
jgi:hypothetical protein